MKRLAPFFISAILLVVASCKKDAPKQSTLPASTVSGTYKITAITGFNDDGTTYPIALKSCAVVNTETFSASGVFTALTQCTPMSTTGTWKTVKDTLTVYYSNNTMSLKGLVTNASSAGFTLDENAAGSDNDTYTFVKQ